MRVADFNYPSVWATRPLSRYRNGYSWTWLRWDSAHRRPNNARFKNGISRAVFTLATAVLPRLERPPASRRLIKQCPNIIQALMPERSLIFPHTLRACSRLLLQIYAQSIAGSNKARSL